MALGRQCDCTLRFGMTRSQEDLGTYATPENPVLPLVESYGSICKRGECTDTRNICVPLLSPGTGSFNLNSSAQFVSFRQKKPRSSALIHPRCLVIVIGVPYYWSRWTCNSFTQRHKTIANRPSATVGLTYWLLPMRENNHELDSTKRKRDDAEVRCPSSHSPQV